MSQQNSKTIIDQFIQQQAAPPAPVNITASQVPTEPVTSSQLSASSNGGNSQPPTTGGNLVTTTPELPPLNVYNQPPKLVKAPKAVTKTLKEPVTKQAIKGQVQKDDTSPEIVENIGDIAEVTEAITNFTQRIRTPGGIGAMFALVLFLLWAIMPTRSGYTRLQLLWYTLLGRTVISDTAQVPLTQQQISQAQQAEQQALGLQPQQPLTQQQIQQAEQQSLGLQGQGPSMAQTMIVPPDVQFSFSFE